MITLNSPRDFDPFWPEATKPTHRRHYRGRNSLPPVVTDWNTGMPMPSDPPYWDDMFGSSIRIGMVAARNTFKPAIAVWALMIGIASLYFMVPQSHALFDRLVAIQKQTGVLFPTIGMGLSVGILVELVRVATSANRRWTRENTINAAFNFVVFGIMGLTQHFRYAYQNEWIGSGNSPRELISKVVFDQFVWTVIFANPYQAICYLWKNHHFSWRAVREEMLPVRTFWGTRMLPVLISNWAFWIPMNFIIYAFPAELQIPFAILAVTIWVMLLCVLTTASQRNSS